MEIELLEIRDFLALRPPFDTLSEDRLNQLPEMLQIRYLRRGSNFPPTDTDQSYLYIVRSGAIALYNHDNQLREKLGEGDYYTIDCQLIDFEDVARAEVDEDCLIYLLPCLALQILRNESSQFTRHFNASLRERMKHAVSIVQENQPEHSMDLLTLPVRELLQKEAVTMDTHNTIQQVAQVMTDNSVSSVMLLKEGRLEGIITDRDLRKRCIAEGYPTNKPVTDIMTRDPTTVHCNTLVLQALMSMTKLHIHHLPVMNGSQVAGMITATDLARIQTANPAYMATDIRKASSLDSLVKAMERLPDLQLQLTNSSATALHIGEVISSITDSLTSRLLELAEAEIGPPPVPYVWVCGGSQARMEQSAHSDQDNALIISDSMKPEDDLYFANLARIVTDGLDACGYIYCPGDSMASNPQWRQPLAKWKEYFNGWIKTPEPKALMLASIFFDLRPVCGDFTLFHKLQRKVVKRSSKNNIFIAYLAGNALTHRPPLGFFRTFVLVRDGRHDDTLDIKHRGVVPITDIARLLALSAGVKEINTTARLKAVANTPLLSREMGGNLIDGLEFIANLRIKHQANQIRRGELPDNYLPPDELSELERKHLKDTFKVIAEMQEVLENRYQLARFR
ncbi:MAG: cyclic nucleotide-binding/CBS domain-containing protein [Gammaproteobacteria bacterium]|nr:cyclic nucleotide-binding/CBS domain-containing protein [Gammaproteobacteria bacterium]